jgi:hypothetical protein
MGCGRGIHDGGFRLHPWSDHSAAHSTGGKTDTRMAAYPFDLPSIREGIDIQDAMVFSKPYRGLDWRSIPFETLQVEIPLGSEWAQVWVMHGTAFMLDAVGMFACHVVDISSAKGHLENVSRYMPMEHQEDSGHIYNQAGVDALDAVRAVVA